MSTLTFETELTFFIHFIQCKHRIWVEISLFTVSTQDRREYINSNILMAFSNLTPPNHLTLGAQMAILGLKSGNWDKYLNANSCLSIGTNI